MFKFLFRNDSLRVVSKAKRKSTRGRKTLSKRVKVLNLLNKGESVTWKTLRNKFEDYYAVTDDKYNEKEFNLSLNYFSLDHTKKTHFKEIRAQYKKYIENKERDKETTNIHFKLLRNQYDEYLKSC